jgi:hypothetical protein
MNKWGRPPTPTDPPGAEQREEGGTPPRPCLNHHHHHHHVMPFRIPFAGEGELFTPDSILSHCCGALLPMFDTVEATTLCQLCREFKTTVADFPWEDERTVIKGSVAGWRTCIPRARWANVGGYDEHINNKGRRTQVMDADFAHFVGLRRLNMMWCSSITDAGLVHLKGIHTLDMYACWQSTITDLAFSHLQGIHTLDMSHCDQRTITDQAFSYLKGIHTLNISHCSQPNITDLTLSYLKGIHILNMSYCILPTITDQAFSHLKGIQNLNIMQCSQLNIRLRIFPPYWHSHIEYVWLPPAHYHGHCLLLPQGHSLPGHV